MRNNLTFLSMYKNLPQNRGQVIEAIENCEVLPGISNISIKSLCRVSLNAWLQPQLCSQNLMLEISEHLSFHSDLFSKLEETFRGKSGRGTRMMDIPYIWPRRKEMMTLLSASGILQETRSKVISYRRHCSQFGQRQVRDSG